MSPPAPEPPPLHVGPAVDELDHLGLAVLDLQASSALWERVLGVRASAPEEVPSQRVRVSFLSVGTTHLELLQPTSPEASMAKFLEKRGEGLHHIAFRVPDVRSVLERLRSQGIRLIDEVPRPGARGRWVAFAHPSSFHGVLTEFVQEGAPRS
jgi:methylmalonyl-CoA/ethylmalonyl-CoA epimerase